MCFITAGPSRRIIIKAVRVGGGEDNGGHVLRETTSRGLCGLVCPSRTSEREGEGYCVKGGWREGEERVKERMRRSVNPIPNPDPNPDPSSADVDERGVASIGVRSSGNLCVDEEYA